MLFVDCIFEKMIIKLSTVVSISRLSLQFHYFIHLAALLWREEEGGRAGVKSLLLINLNYYE
jgi:hypothetical protein